MTMSVAVTVSGRHLELTDAMKNYAEEKLSAVLEGRHKITRAEVVLSREKTRSKAEVIVHGKKLDAEAVCEAYDMYEAIDEAVAKVERQIERYFDKMQDHHKASHGETSAIMEEPAVGDDWE
jgi:putative sigma-54 modulation protein